MASQRAFRGGILWGWFPSYSHLTTPKSERDWGTRRDEVHNFKLHVLLCSQPSPMRGKSWSLYSGMRFLGE